MKRFILAAALFVTAAHAQTPAAPAGLQINPNRVIIGQTPGTVAGGDALAAESATARANEAAARAIAAAAIPANTIDQPNGPAQLDGNGALRNPTLATTKNPAVVRLGDSFPQNPSGNAGLATTYMGSGAIPDPGHMHGINAHQYIQGYTRGWDEGTCIISVMANAPTNFPGCSQGGFGDMAYRQAYAGQDSTGMFVFAQGITPIANAAPVTTFDSVTLTNLAGASQVVARVTFSPPLTPAQVAAINASHGPMRVETNNRFFGYAIPFGMTLNGLPVLPASADGTTLLVDNWTRAIANNTAAPTLAYALNNGSIAAGTGVYPNGVGMTTGSAALAAYTVTVDFNKDMDALGATLRATNSDVLVNLRVMEFGIVNDKTGPEVWDDNNPLNDTTNGQPFGTHLFFGGCQNDDGVGNGHCGSTIFGAAGMKRIIICDNPADNAGLGGTDCVLDTKSFYGYKSTKTSGYTLWLDPANTGMPVFYQDWQGNIQSKGFINAATLQASGSVTASGYVVGSTPGVSCPAGGVSLSTLTIANGLVTHC